MRATTLLPLVGGPGPVGGPGAPGTLTRVSRGTHLRAVPRLVPDREPAIRAGTNGQPAGCAPSRRAPPRARREPSREPQPRAVPRALPRPGRNRLLTGSGVAADNAHVVKRCLLCINSDRQ